MSVFGSTGNRLYTQQTIIMSILDDGYEDLNYPMRSPGLRSEYAEMSVIIIIMGYES